MNTHMQKNVSPATNHAAQAVIDVIQATIASAPEAQRQAIRALERWWLHSGRHRPLARMT